MTSLDYEVEKAAFREFYDGSRNTLIGAIGSSTTLVRSLLASKPDIAISDVEGRIKEREECLRKFSLKYRTHLESAKKPYTIRGTITDLIGLRIVCLYEDDVERIRELISGEFEVLDVTDKITQIEKTEGSFGYKGLHLDLKLNKARQSMAEYRIYAEYPFELQIRTVVQHSWSIIDHKIKYKKSIPNPLKRRINTLAALFELADREFRAIRDATKAEIEQVETTTYADIEAETKAAETVTAAEKSNTTDAPPGMYSPLNAFSFLRIARHFFPTANFEAHKVDGFTQEIVSLKPGISRGKFNYYLRETITKVKAYQVEFESSGSDDTLNPFTVIRHCLYLGDRKVFASILTDAARTRFENWLGTKSSDT